MRTLPQDRAWSARGSTESAAMEPLMSDLTLRVYGKPIPQGSMVKSLRGMRHQNKHLEGWRKAIGWAALLAMKEQGFTLAGKNVHFGAILTFQFDDSRSLQNGRNDLDKLVRACFDALSGVVFPDDSCVVELRAKKELVDEKPGVVVRLWETDDLPVGKTISPEWLKIPF